MNALKSDFIRVCKTERGMLANMIINLLASLVLLIFALMNLNPSSPLVRVGYSDIGGYKDGSWDNLLAFPILAIIFGIFHSIIALRVYRKKGSGMAQFILVTTTVLIAATTLVLMRLLGMAS